MEVSTALLVVLMFNAIIGIGIANILMAFAAQVSSLARLEGRRLGAIWLLLMLLSYLGMFWNSTLLIEREIWTYRLFLLVIAGPILLLFASSLMSRLLAGDVNEQSVTDMQKTLPRFFILYALVQAWFVGMDLVLFGGWGVRSYFSVVLVLVASVLAVVDSRRLIWSFTLLIAVLVLVDVVLKA